MFSMVVATQLNSFIVVAYSKDIKGHFLDDTGASCLPVSRRISEMLGKPLRSTKVMKKSATTNGEAL